MATVYLIDASPYIFRAYYALPSSITGPSGQAVNAVYGFCNFLIQIIRKATPTHIGVAFDGSLTTSFRNEIYPEYKANRSLPPAELEQQLRDCQRVAAGLGMTTYVDDSYESDDIIATICRSLQPAEHSVVIVSNDKDFAQLVDKNVRFWDYARDIVYDRQKVVEKFGIAPEQIADLLALQGDSVDNIPGIKGVGGKTAVMLLRHFGSLTRIYEELDRLADLPLRGVGALSARLQEQRAAAELSYELARISTVAPVTADLDDLRYQGADRPLLEEILAELGFSAMIGRVPLWKSQG